MHSHDVHRLHEARAVRRGGPAAAAEHEGPNRIAAGGIVVDAAEGGERAAVQPRLRHRPSGRCSTMTGFDSVPRPSMRISIGPGVRARFAWWIDLRPLPGLNAVPNEITSPGSSVKNWLMKATTSATS